MGDDRDERRRRLADVYWIGGPPDAGKTTVADLLGERYGLQVYHFDRQELAHIGRADPQRQPNLYQLRSRLATLDELEALERDWVRTTPAAMAAGAIATWEERVDLAIDDLLTFPGDRPIIAEGPGFFPWKILPLAAAGRATFLIPSRAFKVASHRRRGKSLGRSRRTSDPDRYLANHIERDLLMAASYRRAVIAMAAPWIEVDGTQPVASVADRVAEQFGLRA